MVEFALENQKLRCFFSGRFDTHECETIEQQIREQLTAGPAFVVFDLSGVDFICSSFLKICLETCQAMQGGDFYIVNATPEVRKVFKVARLDEVLKIQ